MQHNQFNQPNSPSNLSQSRKLLLIPQSFYQSQHSIQSLSSSILSIILSDYLNSHPYPTIPPKPIL